MIREGKDMSPIHARLNRRRQERQRQANDEAMRTGLRPGHGGLWVWSGRGWYHGPDIPERRAQAIPLEPCPHPVTTEYEPYGTGGPRTLCLSCGKTIQYSA